MIVLRYELTSDRITYYRSEFYEYTCGRNGDKEKIGPDEVIGFLRRQGFDLRISNLQKMNEDIFKDPKKAFYTIWQVITVIGRLHVAPEVEKDMRKLFDFFDHSRKGRITAIDIKKGLTRLNQPLPNHQIDYIFADLDVNHDGVISFEEFMSCLLQK